MAGTTTLPVRRALRRLDVGSRDGRWVSPARALTQFAAAGLVALALLAVGGAVASRQAAR